MRGPRRLAPKLSAVWDIYYDDKAMGGYPHSAFLEGRSMPEGTNTRYRVNITEKNITIYEGNGILKIVSTEGITEGNRFFLRVNQSITIHQQNDTSKPALLKIRRKK
jgi:hypothetical protein